MRRNVSSGSKGLFQDSHVAKLLGLVVGADCSCSSPPDAALSGWDSSAFLSQFYPGSPARWGTLRSGKGVSPVWWLQRFPMSSDLVPMVGISLRGKSLYPKLNGLLLWQVYAK